MLKVVFEREYDIDTDNVEKAVQYAKNQLEHDAMELMEDGFMSVTVRKIKPGELQDFDGLISTKAFPTDTERRRLLCDITLEGIRDLQVGDLIVFSNGDKFEKV